MTDRHFIRFSGIAALITGLTTIGVHYVVFPADTFEQRLLLSQNNLYIAHRWMIILHCLCVIISMLGIALLKFRDNRGFIALGFLFYCVFGIAEITRMFSVLRYLNPLRLKYLETTDEATKVILQQSIEQFNFAGLTLFSLFALAFAIGNLCYGIVLSGDNGKTRWLGYGFLFWSFMSFLGMANEFLEQPWIDKAIEINSKTFQPLFRMIIGIWLLYNTSSDVRASPTSNKY